MRDGAVRGPAHGRLIEAPAQLGLVVVFTMMIGLLAPPMGLALLLGGDIANVLMKEVLPNCIPPGITLALITQVPAITTLVPTWGTGQVRPAATNRRRQ